MKRCLIGFVLVNVFLVVPSAFATPAPVVNWSDGFEAYAIGSNLHDVGYPWSTGGDLNSYTVQDGGGGNHVVQVAQPSGTQYEWCEGIPGTQGAANVQWLHFQARSSETATDARFRDSVAITTNGGAEIARFQFNATYFKSKITWAGHDGGASKTQYNDGLWHDFDIKYDRTVGTIEFYYDNAPYANVVCGENRAIENVEFWGQTWYGGPGWQYDDLSVGTPEPAMLLLLVMGALPMLRRRVR